MAKQQLKLFEHTTIIDVEKPSIRPYQEKGIAEMKELIANGARRILLTCPTGGGKTVIASHLIDSSAQYGMRVLFVAHRIELINQTAIQLARFGIVDIGVIKADDKRHNPFARVQIASIDTLRSREKPEADIVIIDECHRALADSYRTLFAHYTEALHIGLSATPFRTDNQGLGEIYEALVVCAKPSQLIQDRFILQPRIFAGPLAPDITSVDYSQLAHDYHNGQLSQAMMKRELVGNIVQEWKRHAENKRTVVFAVNVAHSKMIAEEFEFEGVRAKHLDGTTDKDTRTLILCALERGDISVVCTCDVLSEGWDQPSVKCAILARPTQSTRLHLQQVGRILRPWENPDTGLIDTALILDHAGNCERHGLPQDDREFDLQLGQKHRERAMSVRTCEKCYAIFSGTKSVCPECGIAVEPKATKLPTEDRSVELVELNSKAIATDADRQRLFFLKELAKARSSGTKPGAVAYRFKEKFGKWPPFTWSQQAKSMFNGDAGWQELVAERTKTREHWQQHNEDKAFGASAPTPSDDGFTPEYTEDEIPF